VMSISLTKVARLFHVELFNLWMRDGMGQAQEAEKFEVCARLACDQTLCALAAVFLPFLLAGRRKLGT
jgi:hypothetical protein